MPQTDPKPIRAKVAGPKLLRMKRRFENPDAFDLRPEQRVRGGAKNTDPLPGYRVAIFETGPSCSLWVGSDALAKRTNRVLGGQAAFLDERECMVARFRSAG